MTSSSSSTPSLENFRRHVESLLPHIDRLKPFQWEIAVELVYGRSVFCHLPCNSGKTLIWIAFSVNRMLQARRSGESQGVTIVYVPMNQIINDQLPKINAIPGMEALCFRDEPEKIINALNAPSLNVYTVIFYNPNEKTTDTFEMLIKNAIKLRIQLMVYDEGGILTKWGSGDFRAVLRNQQRYLLAWFKNSNQPMPFIVLTGAANKETRELLRSWFLGPTRQWDVNILKSPLEHCHVVVDVTVLPNNNNLTREVTKSIVNAHDKSPPPSKFIVLGEFVKDLAQQTTSLQLGLNPANNVLGTTNVVLVFAHKSCIDKETNLRRFKQGRGEDSNLAGIMCRGTNPDTLVGSYGMLIAGWNEMGIVFGAFRGQPDSGEDVIQALNRLARGLDAWGRCQIFVSYERRCEQQWRRHDTMFKTSTDDATRADALRQKGMVDCVAHLLMYSDFNCLMVLLDRNIVHTSTMKSCDLRHKNDPTRWCSSCTAKSKNLGVVHELELFIDIWYPSNTNKSAPSNMAWSELETGSGDAISEVSAACIKAFLKDQDRSTSGSRSHHIAELRSMLSPLQLKQHIVRDFILQVLPTSASWVTLGTIKQHLLREIPDSNIQIITDCVQRLILKGVLQDRPPQSSTKITFYANEGNDWLVGHGDLFGKQGDWPRLQSPPRPSTRFNRSSSRGSKRTKNGGNGSGSSNNSNSSSSGGGSGGGRKTKKNKKSKSRKTGSNASTTKSGTK